MHVQSNSALSGRTAAAALGGSSSSGGARMAAMYSCLPMHVCASLPSPRLSRKCLWYANRALRKINHNWPTRARRLHNHYPAARSTVVRELSLQKTGKNVFFWPLRPPPAPLGTPDSSDISFSVPMRIATRCVPHRARWCASGGKLETFLLPLQAVLSINRLALRACFSLNVWPVAEPEGPQGLRWG